MKSTPRGQRLSRNTFPTARSRGRRRIAHASIRTLILSCWKNQNLETNSFVLQDAAGKPIRLAGPHIAVEDLVPLIPPTAYRAVTVGDTTYWTFTLVVRLPGLGKVRRVVSFKSAELTGTYVVWVTNRVDWGAQRMIALYLERWPIENLNED